MRWRGLPRTDRELDRFLDALEGEGRPHDGLPDWSEEDLGRAVRSLQAESLGRARRAP